MFSIDWPARLFVKTTDMKQFLSFIRKEFYHIFRDKVTMLILLVIPVIQVILFGFAITTEIRCVPVAVFDRSKDEFSRRLTERIGASEYFDLYGEPAGIDEAEQWFRRGKVRLVLVFPEHFSQTLLHEGSVQVQILADATDPNEATTLTQYVQSIAAAYTRSIPGVTEASVRIVPQVKLLYNPQMKGAYNFVPGVMGLILMLICALMTSVGVVKEKEIGTMEVLLVSPMKPIYIILAKVAPYLLLSMINITTILLLAAFLLDVPIAGSVALLFLLSVIYTVVALSLGVFISTVTATQQAAMLVSLVALMLPVILLSGMVFPIANMPVPFQVASNIVPARWYIVAVKDVMIKGLGISDIWREMLILSGMAAVLVVVSISRFKIRLQ